MNSYTLPPDQLSLLPTEEEVQRYEKRGFYVSPVVLDSSILDNAIAGAKAMYRGEKNRECPPIIGPANDEYDENKILLNNEYASMQRTEIWDVVSSPIVSAIASRLARTDEVRLFADALMCKKPARAGDNGVFGWHTDKAYWPSCTSNDMLTAWIPFQDVSIDMGPMHVIENSHKWKWTDELQRYCAAGVQDLEDFERYLERSGYDFRNVPMTLKKGQISFHNGNTFHGSSVNSSENERMTLTIHLQDKKNTHRPAFNEKGERIFIGYDRMCRKDDQGNPDYRDPNWFPVLWSE
jgi:ectoine hydroxylase-related dioxygenase (phytanoyl-CoA dioxygenase family)